MAETVLFVPGYGVSPRAHKDVPGLRAALERLSEYFDVTIFHWPTVEGGPSAPTTWQAAAGLLHEAMPARGHLVAIAGNITYALMALQKESSDLRSIVADGFEVPAATLEALGMYDLARAVEASVRIETSSEASASIWMADADEKEIAEMGARMHRDSDWRMCEEFGLQAATLNLLESASPILTPACLIVSELAYPSWDERELFLRFFPNTEVTEMPPWQLHKVASGRHFADLAIPFMQKHSGRTVLTTVLFTDIVDSTVQATTLGGPRWSQVLAQFHQLAGHELQKADGKLVDTAGDGFLAVFDDPSAAIRCATIVSREVADLGVETRSGVHSGQVEISGDKYSGVAVHTAARIAAQAAPGEVLVSETVRQVLAGSAAIFEDRGKHRLKGISEPIQLYNAGI